MSDNPAEVTTEKVATLFKTDIEVEHNGEHFKFKIPSIKDRMRIASLSAKMRRDSDPDSIGSSYGYDQLSMVYFDSVATFVTLLATTDAKWVYTPDAGGKPSMDIDKWDYDRPVMEVIEKFYKELSQFRN